MSILKYILVAAALVCGILGLSWNDRLTPIGVIFVSIAVVVP